MRKLTNCMNCGCPTRNPKFCNRSCAASFNNKGRTHSQETRLKISKSIKESEIFKERNNLINPSIPSSLTCPVCKTHLESNHVHLAYKKYCSRECFVYDQQNGWKYTPKPKGGLRKGSGKGKKGNYKGIQCDSTYELVWVIYNLDHNISFERNTKGFKYTHNGKNRVYYPDFIQDGAYIEIKGFFRKKDKSKIKQFPQYLKILMEKDLKPYFEYVTTKYNVRREDLYTLYDGNPSGI